MKEDFKSTASVMTVSNNGTKEWYRDGRLHREDGPAIEVANGLKMWLRNGQLHRKDGPAIEFTNGGKMWYRDGQCHRDDGPALEEADGSIAWWEHGKKIASFSAQDVADCIAAHEENRTRDFENEIGAIQGGLPQPVTVARPLRLRRS